MISDGISPPVVRTLRKPDVAPHAHHTASMLLTLHERAHCVNLSHRAERQLALL
jgi:hypothetical protein